MLKIERFIYLALILSAIFYLSFDFFKDKRLQRELTDTHNQLAEALGTIEVSDGVYMRLAEEHSNLNRNLEDILGENSRLSGIIEGDGQRIEELIQINSTLREQLRFSSSSNGSSASTTVISRNCPSTPNVDSNAQTSVGNDIDVNTNIPNVRVDFSLRESLFLIEGHTTSNPSYAELTLTQEEPFVLDIAVTQNRDGQWSAYAAEQNGLLELNISQLAVNPNIREEKFYERIGFGINTIAGGSGLLAGPIVSAEVGDRYYVYGGAVLDTEANVNGTIGVTFRPFRRRRNIR